MLLLIALAALWNGVRADVTPPASACEVTVQFFTGPSPTGGLGGQADNRYGVRLSLGHGLVVLPSDDSGRVTVYMPREWALAFDAVPLYMDPTYNAPDAMGSPRYLARCGLNVVQTPFGT